MVNNANESSALLYFKQNGLSKLTGAEKNWFSDFYQRIINFPREAQRFSISISDQTKFGKLAIPADLQQRPEFEIIQNNFLNNHDLMDCLKFAGNFPMSPYFEFFMLYVLINEFSNEFSNIPFYDQFPRMRDRFLIKVLREKDPKYVEKVTPAALLIHGKCLSELMPNNTLMERFLFIGYLFYIDCLTPADLFFLPIPLETASHYWFQSNGTGIFDSHGEFKNDTISGLGSRAYYFLEKIQQQEIRPGPDLHPENYDWWDFQVFASLSLVRGALRPQRHGEHLYLEMKKHKGRDSGEIIPGDVDVEYHPESRTVLFLQCKSSDLMIKVNIRCEPLKTAVKELFEIYLNFRKREDAIDRKYCIVLEGNAGSNTIKNMAYPKNDFNARSNFKTKYDSDLRTIAVGRELKAKNLEESITGFISKLYIQCVHSKEELYNELRQELGQDFDMLSNKLRTEKILNDERDFQLLLR